MFVRTSRAFSAPVLWMEESVIWIVIVISAADGRVHDAYDWIGAASHDHHFPSPCPCSCPGLCLGLCLCLAVALFSCRLYMEDFLCFLTSASESNVDRCCATCACVDGHGGHGLDEEAVVGFGFDWGFGHAFSWRAGRLWISGPKLRRQVNDLVVSKVENLETGIVTESPSSCFLLNPCWHHTWK